MRKAFSFILAFLCIATISTAQEVKLYGEDGTYLGKVSKNKYDPESISNPYGQYGSKYSSTSVNNEYSQYGSQYSSQSATNPYSNNAPKIIGTDGNGSQYLGRESANQYNSESSSNKYGQYGSEYSGTSTKNKYSKWGQAAENKYK